MGAALPGEAKDLFLIPVDVFGLGGGGDGDYENDGDGRKSALELAAVVWITMDSLR